MQLKAAEEHMVAPLAPVQPDHVAHEDVNQVDQTSQFGDVVMVFALYPFNYTAAVAVQHPV